MLLAVTNPEVCLIIAVVLFVVGGVMSLLDRAWVMALLFAGLVFLAISFIIDP